MSLTQSYVDTVDPPVFAANFDYFRMAPEKWILMLTRLAQTGISTITVPVPWGFHQLEPNSIDLAGTTNTRHNLVGLVKLCARLEIRCILSLGPYYADSGILNDGLPTWLSPDVDDATLSVAVKSWYKAVGSATAKYQWPNGSIIGIILDFETGQKERPDLNKQVTGVKWPIWLRKRYEGIEALNAAYGTNYRTVNQVEFPQPLPAASTPLAKDAREFLNAIRHSAQQNYQGALVDAGWNTPVYFSVADGGHKMPLRQDDSPLAFISLDDHDSILNFPHPVQIDPVPPDVGATSAWATAAPVRADGSIRRDFWKIRHHIWQSLLPNAQLEKGTLTASFETWGLVTAARDIPLKITLTKGTKPLIYRLCLNGQLRVADTLKAARNRLTGPYLTEDSVDYTDLVFYLNNPLAPVDDFLHQYLYRLLTTQLFALAWAGSRADKLGQSLTSVQANGDEVAPTQAKKTSTQPSFTIAEARRGLSEAEAALKKAMTSIGGLQAGFDTMLGKEHVETPGAVSKSSVAITADVFEGSARETLVEASKICASVATQLKSAAEEMQSKINTSQNFTPEQYQDCYAFAVAAAQDARKPMLSLIARMRVEFSAEQLPLVTWRIHNQIQAIAAGLRWGVLRK